MGIQTLAKMTLEVHRLHGLGLSTKDIAEKLGMSPWSVRDSLKKPLIHCDKHGHQWASKKNGKCVGCVAVNNHQRVLKSMAEKHLLKVGTGPERLCRFCNSLRPRATFHGTKCGTCKSKARYSRINADPDRLEKARKYRALHNRKVKSNQERRSARNASWLKTVHERMADGSSFKLRWVTSKAVRQSLKDRNSGKRGLSWEKLVGYTVQELRSHLEALFKPGMTWDNYGKWHVDHKKPQVLFEFDSADHPEFRACWALSNLQPLWALDNLRKGDSYSMSS